MAKLGEGLTLKEKMKLGISIGMNRGYQDTQEDFKNIKSKLSKWKEKIKKIRS